MSTGKRADEGHGKGFSADVDAINEIRQQLCGSWHNEKIMAPFILTDRSLQEGSVILSHFVKQYI